ncbi:Scaffold attachment factor B2 [Saguinus oedipus]|uniref:Scaffold attachment factor B2 n=1 Tax=Saguinus oedipus TaxID=9490 RepID=A0ABQ9TR71_SAGOE|nr:Scaffold attachment factor B2 [Saguinus oedipus]
MRAFRSLQGSIALAWQVGSRDWGEHNQRLEEHQARTWQGAMDTGAAGREHTRWQGGERGLSGPSGPGHMASRGGVAG